MKTKKYWIWVIVSFSILVVVCFVQQIITGETDLSAKDKETDSNLTSLYKLAISTEPVFVDEKEVLQGLEGVHVLVADIESEVEKYGLTEKDLQTDTELQLRQYGIKVLNREEWTSTRGLPYIKINVNVAIREEVPFALAAISVDLRETVLLPREPKRICIGASTWHRGSVWRVGLDRIKELREKVKDHVSEFINEYLAANPKDGSIKEKGSVFDDLKKPKDN